MRLPLWLRWRSGRDLDEEMEAHLEIEIEDNLSRGMSHEEATVAAQRKFGNPTRVRESVRDGDPLALLDGLLQDLRYAIRLWKKNPGFALAAVATIGLGIGVNAAIFTLANAVMFKSLAYEGTGHIVYLQGTEPGCDFPCDTGRSYKDYLEFRAAAKSFDALVGYSFTTVNLSDNRALPERYRAMRITSNGFSTFGQKPVAGRDFAPDDALPGAAPVAVLTHALWESRYNKDPSLIGKTIRVNEVPTTVAGVMPPAMQFRVGVDLWVPLVPTGDWQKRENRSVMILGRLAAGVPVVLARAELDTISRRLEAAYPADKDIGIQVLEGKDYFNPRVKTVLVGLWIVVGLVLLVACANVANLLLGRAVVRSREISIRISLGAGRWRVIRQLLIESVVLSLTGGVLGWLLANWGVRLFDVAIAGTGKPAWLDFSMDYTVFAYLTAISIAAGILFGLVPALRLSRVDVHATLKDGGYGTMGGSRGRFFAGLLVVSQMAVAVMLLVGTVLVVQTLLILNRSQIGVNPAGVLTMNLELPESKYSRPTDRAAFFERIEERLKALPGVEAASVATALPGHGSMAWTYELEGVPSADPRARPQVRGLVIDRDYFRVMEVRPLAGRDFTGADGPNGLPVVVVNRSFAAAGWPGGNAVGRRLRIVENGKPEAWLTVAGVVPDIWQNDMLRRDFQPLIYLPFRQRPLANMSVVARTRVPAGSLAQAFRREVQAVDENLPVYALRTLEADIELHDWALRVFGSMFGIFAAIAMVLACTGLYAVIAASVSQRTREIGVRIAMGASPSSIAGLVFSQGMAQVALGLGIGLLAAFGLSRALRAILAGAFQPGPATFLMVAAVLVAAGLVACALPARRATRVDPVVALRFD